MGAPRRVRRSGDSGGSDVLAEHVLDPPRFANGEACQAWQVSYRPTRKGPIAHEQCPRWVNSSPSISPIHNLIDIVLDMGAAPPEQSRLSNEGDVLVSYSKLRGLPLPTPVSSSIRCHSRRICRDLRCRRSHLRLSDGCGTVHVVQRAERKCTKDEQI